TVPNTEESKRQGRLTRGRACRKLGGAGPGVRLLHFAGRCSTRARAGPLARRDPRWTLRGVHPESSTL
ncbi:unnamed protein product, partial [Ascophyllum nodosum]